MNRIRSRRNQILISQFVKKKLISEPPVKTVDGKFVDDVSEVRIKETSEKDMANELVSNVSESVDREGISRRG